MIRTVAVSLAVVLLVGATRAQEVVETPKSGGGGGGGGGGDGYSQQYHYSSYPQGGGGGIGGHGGLSIDVGTGVLLAVGTIIVLIALSTLLGGKGNDGWGRSTTNARSINVANLSEKVLSGIEKIYETYNKMH